MPEAQAENSIIGERRVFMTGNEALAWAALAARAEIMYGYPITPQNEIMHYWTRLAPKYGKRFLQTEDELSAGFTTVGGVMAGRKAFTATAGPGNVLMQEPMSMAEAMRLPVVVAVMQRGGPSTGTVIYSQQEVNLTTYGGNGEGLRIVYSTSTHQELFDYMIKAFNTAWRYRFPTFLLADGYQGKMREPLTIYDPAARNVELVPPEAYVGRPGTPGVDRPPAQYRNCYNLEEELQEIVMQNIQEYERISPQIAEHEALATVNADVVVVGHGVVARACKQAVEQLREEGLNVGYFRPITLRPLPVAALQEMAAQVRHMLVVESAYGQLGRLLRDALYGHPVDMVPLYKPGMGITPEEIAAKARELVG